MSEPVSGGRLATRSGPPVPGGTPSGGDPGGARRRASPPVPGPPRALRMLLPLVLGSVVVWEIAAFVGVVAYAHRGGQHGKIIFWALAALGVLAIAVTSVRWRGMTGFQRLAARRAMRRRAAHYRGDAVDDSVQLRLLAGLTLNNHFDRAGNRTGLIGRDLGWSAAIRIADSVVPDPDALIAAAKRACRRDGLPLAAAQVLTWNLPSPALDRPADQPVAQTLRQFFLAVRIADQPTRRAALARGGGPSGAQRATASAAASLAYDITRLGYACSVLDGAELEQYVQLLSGTAGFTGAPGTDAQLRETKSSWSAGRMEQCCFHVGAGTTPADAVVWSVGEPLNFVIASCTVSPGRRGSIDSAFVLRAGMVTQPGPLTVERAGRALDKRLMPVRYRQQDYLRATLPLALDPSLS